MRRFITAGTAALALALATAAGTAHAAVTQPSCDLPTTQAFLGVDGDINSYFLAPGGNFEGGAPGWALAGGAKLATGNNTAGGDPSAQTTSLSLPAGSSATSPLVCVTSLDPWMRFFVRNTGASSSRLGVTVLYTLPTGKPGSILVAKVSGKGIWQPTDAYHYVMNMLAMPSPTGTTNVAFRFAPLDSAGKWQIDDVWVDPLKCR
jgi:hypothetical protein